MATAILHEWSTGARSRTACAICNILQYDIHHSSRLSWEFGASDAPRHQISAGAPAYSGFLASTSGAAQLAVPAWVDSLPSMPRRLGARAPRPKSASLGAPSAVSRTFSALMSLQGEMGFIVDSGYIKLGFRRRIGKRFYHC